MCNATATYKGNVRRAAHGTTTVCSDERVECHAGSAFASSCITDANGARGKARDIILAFWEAMGVARWQGDIANGGGSRWYVRDLVNGGDEWLPLARQGEDARADRAEFSHIISAANGGAWCACGLLPERGAVNAARGHDDIVHMTDEARDLLAAWPSYWEANVARKAALKRL